MAKKKVVNIIKLQIQAGKATPAQPVGPALGSAGINIMGFCKEFNDKTKAMGNMVVPVIISVYQDKTFSFVLKQPPVANLIKQEAKIEKGSGVPNRDKVGTLTKEQVKAIAEKKAPDLRMTSIESAIRMVEGTARSMGVTVKAE